ncbi:MAG: DUF4382 domain-containing protein [Chloroflexota bacterium]
MADKLNKILDDCINRINSGDSVESCQADYPGYSEQLKPLLQAALLTKKTYTFVPGIEAKTAAKHRFDTAMEKRLKTEKETQSWLSRILGKPLTWAALAAVTAAIVGIYFGINQTLYPISPIVPDPNPEGNFILLISDDVNAISDFKSVNVSITKVGLFSNANGGWMEFVPDIKEVDLTTVRGDKSQQIWRGNIPEGEYTKVFIYVSNVQGILKEAMDTNGQSVEIKLPGNKLHISKSFKITENTVTSFTYDLTVIATGNEQSGIKYILKPQADESGADNKPANNKEKDKQE